MGVGVDPAHHVMHDGAHRDRLFDRVDAHVADRKLSHHGDLAVDGGLTKVANVEVDIVAVWAFEGAAGCSFLDEGLGETIPGPELHRPLLRMVFVGDVEGLAKVVVLEIAPALIVDHDAALAASRLGDEDPGARQARRMVLDELHVLQRHPCPVGEGHAVAGLDAAVGGERVDPAGSTGAHDDRLGTDRPHLPGADLDGGDSLAATVGDDQFGDEPLVVSDDGVVLE